MVTAEIVEQIQKEQNGMCACKGIFCEERIKEIHHIYFKSEYNKEDRDERWNLCGLSISCHKEGKKSIHARRPGTTKNIILDKILKGEADKRKPKDQRGTAKHPDLLRVARQNKRWRRKKIDAFKASHNGLSPSQVAYRKQKEWKKQNKV